MAAAASFQIHPQRWQDVMSLLVVIVTSVPLMSNRRSTYNHLSSWLTDARNLTNPNTVSTRTEINDCLKLHTCLHSLVSALSFCIDFSSFNCFKLSLCCLSLCHPPLVFLEPLSPVHFLNRFFLVNMISSKPSCSHSQRSVFHQGSVFVQHDTSCSHFRWQKAKRDVSVYPVTTIHRLCMELCYPLLILMTSTSKLY